MANDTICKLKDDGTVEIQVTNPNGSKSVKIVSLVNFAQAIRHNDQALDLPLLPTGIKKYRQEGDYLVIGIEYPASIIENFTYNNRNYKVPVPQSFWLTLLRKNTANEKYSVIKTHIYSMAMPLYSETQDLYQWPFTNHATDFGPGICWGSHTSYTNLKSACTIANVSSFYSMYFNANFNDHLGWKMQLPNEARGQSYVEFLNNKEHFDSEWMRRANVNIGQAIDVILRGAQNGY